jgi:peptidoglycan/LPS O-acetylase OafA/YrhL
MATERGVGSVSKVEAVSASLSSGRLESIDFLRGVASLGVVIFHAMTFNFLIPNPPKWFLGLHYLSLDGWYGVPLFFVISGFCIHMRVAKQNAQKPNTKIQFLDFWKRRIHRLYPPYLVALCISMVLVYGAYRMGIIGLPLVDRYPLPRAKWMVFDFFLHVTMLHGFSFNFDTMGGNGAYWSLAREEYFYLLYFALIFFRKKIGVWWMLAGVLAVGLGLNLAYGLGDPSKAEFVARTAIVLWFQWVLGMVAVDAYYGHTTIPRIFQSGWATIACAILTKLCWTFVPVLLPFMAGLTFFMLLNVCIAKELNGTWPGRNFLVKWLTRVGVFSYSLYLIHNSVIKVAKKLLKPLSNSQNPYIYLLTAVLLTMASYWVARLFFKVVESRFLNTRISGEPLVEVAATEVHTPLLNREFAPEVVYSEE